MDKKESILSVAFIVHLMVSSCVYEPDGSHINPATRPPATISATIDLLSPNFSSPYALLFPTTFSLQVSNTDKPVGYPEISVDGDLNKVSNINFEGTNLKFELNPVLLQNGEHVVKVKFNIRSSSGSLADKIGLESYLIAKEFKVFVDKDLPSEKQPLSIAMENGLLVIRWPKLLKSNFYIRITHFSYEEFLGGDTVIRDASATKYVDYGYLGGKIDYQLRVFNAYDENVVGYLTFNYTPPIKFSLSDDLTQTIEWDTASLYNKDTDIRFKSLLMDKTVPFKYGKTVGGTHLLGYNEYVHVSILRKDVSDFRYSQNQAFAMSKNFSDFRSICSTSKPYLFTAEFNDLKRWNTQSKLIKEDSILNNSYGNKFASIGQFAISNDASQGILMDGHFGTLFQFNPMDLSKLKQIDYAPLKAQLLEYTTSGRIGNISNNQLLGFNSYYFGDRVAGILDLTTQSVSWVDSLNNDVPTLSPDGKYFVISDKKSTLSNVFKRINGIWNLIGKVPIGKLYFRGTPQNELIVLNNEVRIFDLHSTSDQNGNLSEIRSFKPVFNSNEQLKKILFDESTQNLSIEVIVVVNEFFNISRLKVYDVDNFVLQGYGDALTFDHQYSNGYHFIPGYINKIK